MGKYEQWWNSLTPQMKEYLKKQPIWHDRDLFKFGAVCAIVGFIVGLIAGYEWAWKPVVSTFRPLVG